MDPDFRKVIAQIIEIIDDERRMRAQGRSEIRIGRQRYLESPRFEPATAAFRQVLRLDHLDRPPLGGPG